MDNRERLKKQTEVFQVEPNYMAYDKKKMKLDILGHEAWKSRVGP